MTKKNLHWTERSIDDFVHRIASDFAIQIEKRMENRINQKELAERMRVSQGNVSQSFNNPSNFTLKKVVRFARALGLKVAIVAYDDNDPTNQNGPIHSEIFETCWKKVGKPDDFFALNESFQISSVSQWGVWEVPGRRANYSIVVDALTTTYPSLVATTSWTSEKQLGGF